MTGRYRSISTAKCAFPDPQCTHRRRYSGELYGARHSRRRGLLPGIGYPFVDLKSGGTLQGILDGLGATIGRFGPNTKVIPGHGPVTDRNALVAQRDLILAVRDKVAALVAQNKTLEEVIAAKPTADFDAQVPLGPQTAERFIGWLYAEIKAGH